MSLSLLSLSSLPLSEVYMIFKVHYTTTKYRIGLIEPYKLSGRPESRKEKVFRYWNSRRVGVVIVIFLETSQTLKRDECWIVLSDGVNLPTTIFCYLRIQSLLPVK